MPMKLTKVEEENKLIIERKLYVQRHKLILYRDKCVGCEFCSLVCPREAITITVPEKENGKAKKPIIDVDAEKCHFCGVCNAVCMFGAIQVTVNDNAVIPVVEKESFPKFVRDIMVDESKCPIECIECEEVCPFNLIKVKVLSPEGEEVGNLDAYPDKSKLKVKIDIDIDSCPCCKLCEVKCPEGAIRVSKIVHGLIKIRTELCPEGCRDCVDVCPIPGVLTVGEDGKVKVNEFHCVYCGVCRLVCPVEDAIELKRFYIKHTPVKSGAWNTALEKLTSTEAMIRELMAKGYARARTSVEKRLC